MSTLGDAQIGDSQTTSIPSDRRYGILLGMPRRSPVPDWKSSVSSLDSLKDRRIAAHPGRVSKAGRIDLINDSLFPPGRLVRLHYKIICGLTVALGLGNHVWKRILCS